MNMFSSRDLCLYFSDRESGYENTDASVRGNLGNERNGVACCHARVDSFVALGRP